MKSTRKLLSVLLAVIMVISVIPVSMGAENGRKVTSVSFVTMSDIHLFSQDLTPERESFDSDEAYEEAQKNWLSACRLDAKEYEESEELTRYGLESFVKTAKKNGVKNLLISGDLTRCSEKKAHQRLAQLLKEIVIPEGINVFVGTGNHDINVERTLDYSDGTKKNAESCSPEDFIEIYKDLGYNNATEIYGTDDHTVNGKLLNIRNELSYTANLDEYTQLIAVDSAIYSFDGPAKDETGGEISDECLEWICEKADEWSSKGEQYNSILTVHHNMVPHMECEPSVTFAFPLKDYQRVAEIFADHDIHYVFSGHLHQADCASLVSDNGNVITDCESGSLTSYPNTFRYNTLTTYQNGETEMEYKNISFDDGFDDGVDITGVHYDKGTFAKTSFGLCYGGAILEDGDGTASGLGFAKGLLLNYASGLFTEIAQTGILNYIKLKLNFDVKEYLESLLKPYIGKGIKIGDSSVLSVDNIMWFLEDLCKQVETIYLADSEAFWDMIEPSVKKLIYFKMSDVPVSQEVQNATGVGTKHDYSTLEDVIFTAVYYFYKGNELKDISGDALLNDVCTNLQKGISNIKNDEGNSLSDVVIDVVFNDLVNGVILSRLHFNYRSFFSSDYISQKAADSLERLFKYVFKGDNSFLNIVNTVFSYGILPWDSIFDVVDTLLIKEYWTDSQDESIGVTVASFLIDFAVDDSLDYDCTYNSKMQQVPVTTENYRKPTMISVTMGEDSQTSAVISWFSKQTLPETDIVLKNSQGRDITAVTSMEKSSEKVQRYFPGIDLGIIGIIKYNFFMYRHTVKLTGLTPGETYFYNVGNAEKGWWSDTGKLTMADGSDRVTFIHVSDPQSQSEAQYERGWATVLKTAFEMYPETKFVACSGDLVDYGMNTNMWRWMFDTASETLQSTYLMPATGNHEEKDDYSTVSNFVLPNVPSQDTLSGVYYSYNYNNVHVAVLNTNDLNDDDALNEAQVTWLKNDMNTSNARWKFVVLHKALYSDGSHYDDDDVVAMRKQLGSLMPELNIDMVLQGHDHVYLRTKSLNNNEVVEEKVTYLTYDNTYGMSRLYRTYDNPAGTTYEISGCSGVKLYNSKSSRLTDKYFPRAQKLVKATAPMFSAIQIEDGVLYYNSYLVENGKARCVDQFAIRKDTSQGEQADKALWPQEEETTQTNELYEKIMDVCRIFVKIIKVFMNLYNIYSGQEPIDVAKYCG